MNCRQGDGGNKEELHSQLTQGQLIIQETGLTQTVLIIKTTNTINLSCNFIGHPTQFAFSF